MKKITLEEHFISPQYAQHVRDFQRKAAETGTPSEFEALLAGTLETSLIICTYRLERPS